MSSSKKILRLLHPFVPELILRSVNGCVSVIVNSILMIARKLQTIPSPDLNRSWKEAPISKCLKNRIMIITFLLSLATILNHLHLKPQIQFNPEDATNTEHVATSDQSLKETPTINDQSQPDTHDFNDNLRDRNSSFKHQH